MDLKSRPKRRPGQDPRSRPLRKCVEHVTNPGQMLRHWREGRPTGVTLGRYVKGAKGLWSGPDGEVVLSLDQLRQHVAIVGQSPSEQNHVASRLLEDIAKEDRRAQIFCFDGYSDAEMAPLFEAAMAETGRQPLRFPRQPVNAWSGENWGPVYRRVMQIALSFRVRGATRGASAATLILQLACRLNDEPPRSHRELLDRLDYEVLCAEYGDRSLCGVTAQDVEEIRMNCEAFFFDLGTPLDGERSFGDLDSAYFNLDVPRLGWTAAEAAMRLLLLQLLHYTQHEKDPSRPCVVVMRVPAKQIGDVHQAALLERAREHGVVLIWMLPMKAVIERTSHQTTRLLNDTQTLVVLNNRAWGELETTLRLADVDCGPASRTTLCKSKITKEDLLELSPGRVLVINNNTATLVDVPPATYA